MREISRELAEAMVAGRERPLPPPITEATLRLVVDWTGVAVAGARHPAARMVQAVALRLGNSGAATVFGAGRASAAAAALANGASAHALELDDLHPGSTLHPGAPIIAAAWAIAEREHASGTELLHAVALGYEAALRIGEAVNPSHYRYWHPTGTVATFGAATAAASLLRLDASAMLDALGTAGTQAAGLWEFNTDGAMSKPLHAGKAAFNGVLTADLARAGFTGAHRILEGERGFFHATSAAFDPTRVTEGLGQDWKIAETCHKLHACCGHTHTAIDALLALRVRLPEPTPPRSIEIETYAPGYAIVREPRPRTAAQAQFSLAYAAAAAWRDGAVGLEQFSPARFEDIATLLPLVHIRIADDLTARYPQAWPARVRVTLADGAEYAAAVEFPAGSPQNPASPGRLEQKFRNLATPVHGADITEKLWRALHALPITEDVSGVLAGQRNTNPFHTKNAMEAARKK